MKKRQREYWNLWRNKSMEAKFNYENDPGRIGARLMMERNKNLDATEKKEINSYFNTFRMYCENDVIERFKKLMDSIN